MVLRQASQYVSVAHRPGLFVTGNNLRVDLEVETLASEPGVADKFSFGPYLERVKALLDHRCLFEDEPEFQGRVSTLESITEFLARDLFRDRFPAPGIRWSSVAVVEMDKFRCRAVPDSHEFSFTVRHRNLSLELKGPIDPMAGHVVDLRDVIEHVDLVFNRFRSWPNGSASNWGLCLFEALREGIPSLREASVDLGRHEWVRLARSPAALR